MKSIKFLAALAFPVMFAACTNEELVAVQDDVQQSQEFIGAELVGSDISINVGSGVESRLYGSTWSVTDQLGLGWVVTTGYLQDQVANVAPDQSELYNNLMFFKEKEESNFTTKGNVYKGWHFAYYPYEYMEKLGVDKTITINPVQTENWDTDRYNTGFYLSGREFLSREKLDDNLQLKEDVKFSMYRAINTIGVTIKPSADFTGNAILKNLAVKSISVHAGTYLFPKTISLQPEKLAALQYNTEGKYDEDATEDAVKASFANVLDQSTTTFYQDITTEINNSEINLSGDQILRIHTLPRQLSFTKESVVFTINVVGGTFTIGYVTDATKPEDINNNATIEKLVAAYAADGAMTKHGGVLFEKEGFPFNLMLTTDKFEADYTITKPVTEGAMSEIEQWNALVELANALEDEDPEFTLEEGANVEFTTEMQAPTNGVNVICETAASYKSYITIAGENLTWNPDVNVTAAGVAVKVAEGASLTVEGVFTPHRLDNYGTINAGPNSTIGTTSGFRNQIGDKIGRVNVEFGAYVSPVSGNEGVIAYEVGSYEFETLKDINLLIKGGDADKLKANVNTLVINDIELVCAETTTTEGTEGTTGRYEDEAGTEASTSTIILDLNNVDLEINGGSVSTPTGYSVTAKNVTIAGGAISNVDIAANLTVKECDNQNSFVGNLDVAGNVTVEELGDLFMSNVAVNGTFTNNGTSRLTGSDAIHITELVNLGTLSSDQDILVTDVTLKNSTTVLESETGKKDKTIWYTGTYKFASQDLTGAVAQYSVALLTEAIANAQAGETVSLSGNIDMTASVAVNNIILDGQGSTLTSNQQGILTTTGGTIKNLVIDGNNDLAVGSVGKRGIYNNTTPASNDVFLDNLTIVGTGYTFNMYGQNNADLNVSNCYLEGWTSFTGFEITNFINCQFTVGSYYDTTVPGQETWNGCISVHNPVKFENCDFATNFKIQYGSGTPTITLKNCTLGGVKVTSSNVNELKADLGMVITIE